MRDPNWQKQSEELKIIREKHDRYTYIRRYRFIKVGILKEENSNIGTKRKKKKGLTWESFSEVNIFSYILKGHISLTVKYTMEKHLGFTDVF